jgi:dienelactone hydrolase
MRWRKGLAVGAVVSTLFVGAAMFQLVAPGNTGLPHVEVIEPGQAGIRIEKAGLFGNFFPAQGEGPNAGILLLGGSEGGLGNGALNMALALQQEGFSVLQLAYFGAPGMSDTLERIPLEVFDRGLDWLGAQPGVDRRRLALVGASKGAEAALLVATRRSDVRAVVAGMPTSVVWNGIDWRRGGQSESSSWTSGGQEILTMPFSSWNQAEGVISVYRSIEDPAHHATAERAAIPIEHARAHMLLVCGEAEAMWPACPMSRAIAARAAERDGPPVHILQYTDAGHLVFGPPIPPNHASYQRLGMFGGTVNGNASARADSWPRVITFLKNSTAPEPSADK